MQLWDYAWPIHWGLNEIWVTDHHLNNPTPFLMIPCSLDPPLDLLITSQTSKVRCHKKLNLWNYGIFRGIECFHSHVIINFVFLLKQRKTFVWHNRAQFPENKLGTPTWPLFLCLGTPMWPPWRHMKTLYYERTTSKRPTRQKCAFQGKKMCEILTQLCSCDNDLSLFTARTEVSKWSIFAIVQSEMFHVNPRVNEIKRFIFWCWLRGTLKKSEWPSAEVEPTTFRLLVWMLCPWAIGN